VVAAALGYMEITDTFDRDGGMAMAIMFGIGPLTGLIGGTICAIAIPIRLNRRDLARAASGVPPRPPRSQAQRIGIAILAAGLPVYLLGRLVLWLNEGMSFKSYWAALAVGQAPLLAAIVAAALAAFLVSRNAKR
jgi:hypothetical protein